ncbi:unnamed protein product [Amoebophrya sp. A120]|nr:unnamed protein product [Amoebophrya sp. A120]|eukprot:GSA120T00016470001.1
MLQPLSATASRCLQQGRMLAPRFSPTKSCAATTLKRNASSLSSIGSSLVSTNQNATTSFLHRQTRLLQHFVSSRTNARCFSTKNLSTTKVSGGEESGRATNFQQNSIQALAAPAGSSSRAVNTETGIVAADPHAGTNNRNKVVEESCKSSLLQTIGEKGLIFEFSMLWVLTAWKEIAVGVIRNTAYTFRPVALFFVMGYVVKFLFFLMGAPMLVSFYSVWLFEVGYGLAQCFLSVIFLTQLTYMDLSFRGTVRPMLRLYGKRLVDLGRRLVLRK